MGKKSMTLIVLALMSTTVFAEDLYVMKNKETGVSNHGVLMKGLYGSSRKFMNMPSKSKWTLHPQTNSYELEVVENDKLVLRYDGWTDDYEVEIGTVTNEPLSGLSTRRAISEVPLHHTTPEINDIVKVELNENVSVSTKKRAPMLSTCQVSPDVAMRNGYSGDTESVNCEKHPIVMTVNVNGQKFELIKHDIKIIERELGYWEKLDGSSHR